MCGTVFSNGQLWFEMERSEVGVCCEELYCGHVCRLRSPDGGVGGGGREVGSVEGENTSLTLTWN